MQWTDFHLNPLEVGLLALALPPSMESAGRDTLLYLLSLTDSDLQRKFEWASLSGANDSIWPISPPSSFHRFPIAVVPISPPSISTRFFMPGGADSRNLGIVDQVANCNVEVGSKDEM